MLFGQHGRIEQKPSHVAEIRTGEGILRALTLCITQDEFPDEGGS